MKNFKYPSCWRSLYQYAEDWDHHLSDRTQPGLSQSFLPHMNLEDGLVLAEQEPGSNYRYIVHRYIQKMENINNVKMNISQVIKYLNLRTSFPTNSTRA